MVLEPDTGRCASEEIVPRRGVDTRRCASKDSGSWREVDLVGVPHRLEKGMSASEDARPWRGWIVISHIGWGGERNTLYMGVGTSPWQTYFKNLEGKPERESPKKIISASVGLGCYKYGFVFPVFCIIYVLFCLLVTFSNIFPFIYWASRNLCVLATSWFRFQKN